MKKIAVFASGGGSDFQSVIDAVKSGYIHNCEIDILIAGKPDIYAIERAKAAGIDYRVYERGNYPCLDAMYEEITKLLKQRGVELIVLAGYLSILTPNIVKAYERRIINIHPSLIPKYSGAGYYGIKVHQAVIDNNESVSGATVHYVDEGADTGEIILQETVPVLKGDTARTLQQRVLELEHKLLPQAVKEVLNKI
ncbi:MAG: phosphoribosylglycinamide formyltransferase [Christensenellales bacterium]